KFSDFPNTSSVLVWCMRRVKEEKIEGIMRLDDLVKKIRVMGNYVSKAKNKLFVILVLRSIHDIGTDYERVFTGIFMEIMVSSCAGKAVDIGRDKPLRQLDMLLYSWNGGLDVCVDSTGSLPSTQTRMVDFVPDRVVIDAAHRKCVKYEAKCPKRADIYMVFCLFHFLRLGN
ncbi:hypothetical protein Tco_1435568, partial [Tanacetum coccineum]